MKTKILTLTLLLSILSVNVFSQSSGNNSFVSGNYLGWSTSGGNLPFEIGGNQFMSLTTGGLFGIGTTFSPTYKLDVDAGDINVNTSTLGYRLGGDYVLRHHGDPTSIWVGVGAGLSLGGQYNTFVGNDAGWSNSGNNNTFIGHASGRLNITGLNNTFVGDSSGYSNTYGERNTCIGTGTGFSLTTGVANTFIGGRAGYNNDVGEYNTMVGRNSGYSNHGSYNSFYGKDAGYDNYSSRNCYYGHHAGIYSHNSDYNSIFGYVAGRNAVGTKNCFFGDGVADPVTVGSYNTFIGSGTQLSPLSSITTIYNSTCLGAFSSAAGNNQLILGANRGYANGQIKVGIGLSDDVSLGGPRSALEINADFTNTAYSATGTYGSGLQFRQLTSTTTMTSANYTSPYGKVLTVDGDGVVKLTDDQGAFGYGLCMGTPTTLLGDIGMFLDKYRIYYDGQGYSEADLDMNNSIGLGYTCGDVLPGKLSVNQTFTSRSVNNPTAAGFFHNGDITTDENLPSFSKRSLYVICDGYSPKNEDDGITNVAGDFVATNAEYLNIAVSGRTGIHSPIDTYGEYAFGGYFEANNSTVQNIGVFAGSDGKGSNANYGIYASAPIGFCSSGSCSDAAGYFNGDVFTSGTAYNFSDINLKTNIQPLQNSMTIINALNPKTFSFRNSQFPYLNLPIGTQDGLIAQEVRNVLPQLVNNFSLPARFDSLGNIDTTGTSTPYLAVNYVGVIPYLIGAIKEQQQSIDSLRTQLQDAVTLINNCCGSGQRNSGHSNDEQRHNEEENSKSTINVELSDANTIILDQNSPNPFSEETVITYIIPKEVSKAIIMIYDNSGQVLKTISINERGRGSLHIYAEKLSSGIYSYTLIADGKMIDSKQMVCQK